MKRLATIVYVVILTVPIVPGCAAAIVDDPASLVVRRDTGTTPKPSEAGTTDTAIDEPADAGTEDTGAVAPEIEDTRKAPDTSTTFDSGTGDPCNDCVYSSCVTELTSCIDDAACSAQMDCLTKCFDAACADKCALDYPSSKVDTLMTCVATKCSAACGGP